MINPFFPPFRFLTARLRSPDCLFKVSLSNQTLFGCSSKGGIQIDVPQTFEKYNFSPALHQTHRCTCRRLHKRIETVCIAQGLVKTARLGCGGDAFDTSCTPALPGSVPQGPTVVLESWAAAYRLHDGVESSREAELPLIE